MRCDGCKHWLPGKEHQDWEAESAGFGHCRGVRERWRIEDEVKVEKAYPFDGDDYARWNKAWASAATGARAYVQDGSQYKAELLTAPDFFCALFEPR